MVCISFSLVWFDCGYVGVEKLKLMEIPVRKGHIISNNSALLSAPSFCHGTWGPFGHQGIVVILPRIVETICVPQQLSFQLQYTCIQG